MLYCNMPHSWTVAHHNPVLQVIKKQFMLMKGKGESSLFLSTRATIFRIALVWHFKQIMQTDWLREKHFCSITHQEIRLIY